MDTKDIKDHAQWAIALVVAGVALAVPSVVAGDKNTLMLALGMVFFGVGQMRNRQSQEAIHFDQFGRPTMKVTGHPHRFTLLGTIMSALGVGLFAKGLWPLVSG